MKRFTYVLTLIVLTTLGASAQKYAFIDTDYIVNNIPAYVEYSKQIDQKSEAFQKEVTKAGDQVQALYDTYQAQAASMTDQQKKENEERIIKAEKAAMELGRKYFGPEGEIAKLKENLLNPIHDQIYEAAKQISLKEDYAAIIDRATATSIIFAQPKYDISDQIIRFINK